DPSALVGAAAIRSLAAESGLPIEVVEEFSERLPFPGGSFDVVFARAVLHHMKDLDAACCEFARVLKPGGRLVAVREHVISRSEDLPAFLDAHPLHRYYGGEHAYLLAEYQRAIQAAGLRIEAQIAPLRRVINLAPPTARSVQREIARRLTRGPGVLEDVVATLLAIPGVWLVLLPLLERVDQRPGRSFFFLGVYT